MIVGRAHASTKRHMEYWGMEKDLRRFKTKPKRLVIFSTWYDHVKSDENETPRFLKSLAEGKIVPPRATCGIEDGCDLVSAKSHCIHF